MVKQPSLDHFWESVQPSNGHFDPDQLGHLPYGVRRYLQHAIAPGAPLVSAVRLHMQGEIKLQNWLHFKAEEVLCWNRGMIWHARVMMKGLPIIGSDMLIDGEGGMLWKLLGLLPMMTAEGPDITRSTIGRAAAEALWLPSALAGPGVLWNEIDNSHISADYTAFDQTNHLSFSLDERGRPIDFTLPRWGNPDKTWFRYVDFGGVIDQERTFGDYTIPTHLRLGWYFGSDRFETEGEFFRVTVESAEFK